MLATWIAVGVIALIIVGATIKIVRDKKNGLKCTGCPDAQACSAKRQSHCNCTYHDKL